jgi:SOS response regulatory protein OraA/RecX
MFYDATGKSKEQIIEELRQAGISEHDIGIVLKHINLDEKYEQVQKEFDENWNKWGHKRKRKSKLLKEA